MPNLARLGPHRGPLMLGFLVLSIALVVPAVAVAASASTSAGPAHAATAADASTAEAASMADAMTPNTRPPAALDSSVAIPPVGNGMLFKSTCMPSHIAMDDPIVFPGVPGASHEHVFFGNITTDAFSTLATLQNQATSCRIPQDHAAYWVPALLQDGAAVAPLYANAYYLADGARGHIAAFPAGLKMIAGNSHATGPQSTSILGWKCANQVVEALSATPTLCPARVDQVLVIRFPDCWNGRDLDSADHASHLAYRVRGACPAADPVAVPRLSFNVHYRLTSLAGLSLASGSLNTAHADFFNAWNEAALTTLVQRNLN